MDLVGRRPNGKLDSMAACMLLWSGAVSFDESEVTWDGHTYRVGSPTIHDDVISLYSLSHAAVSAVMPDLMQLIDELGHDEDLRAPKEQVAEAVRQFLPAGQLTGVSLFLLQSKSHLLVIDSVDASTIRMRYDAQLARGVPQLQDLLCRMACHLRSFRGDEGAFAIHFVERGAAGTAGHRDTSVTVSPERYDFPTAAVVDDVPTADHLEQAAATDPEILCLQSASLLESSAYTTRHLIGATESRIKGLEETQREIEAAKPNPNDKRYQPVSASSLGLPTSERASRSLVIRSAIYIAIGVVIFLIGRACFFDCEAVAQWMLKAYDQVMDTVLDTINLATGQTNLVGKHDLIQAPMDYLSNALRVVGFIIMTLGIVFPVRKIIRHKRRLDRELAHTRSHVEFLSALASKQEQTAELTFTLALEGWKTELDGVNEEINLARDSVRMLKDAKSRTDQGLTRCYAMHVLPTDACNLAAACTMIDYLNSGSANTVTGENGALEKYQRDLASSRVTYEPEQATMEQPTLRTTVRSAHMLAKSIAAEPTEERRHQRIAEHCEQASSLVLRVTHT